MPSNDRKPLPRRGFLALLTRALLWAIGGSGVSALVRYLSYMPPSAQAGTVTLDLPEVYSPGSMTVIAAAGAAVYRDDRGFFARSLTCVHLGCRVAPSGGGTLACPCHGSRFTLHGSRLSGPAGRNLDNLVLSLDDEGRLVLDPSGRVDADWRLPLPPPSHAGPTRMAPCRT
jgi:Rieske Fe-S protein